MNLEFYKMREGAKLPVRAHPTDAGMDVFYCPNGDSPGKLYEAEDFWIPSGESRMLSTGLKVGVPKNHMLEIKNKSGIALKRQLIVGACVIDSGYNGEIFINLHNLGPQTQIIEPGEKIAQAVLIPIVHCSISEAPHDYLNLASKRGTDGFGSTGRF